jgi:hypothetical protein
MAGIDIRVWERQTGETGKAWTAFVTFRDTSAGERNLQLVSERMQLSNSSIEKMSSRFRWSERVREYDSYIDRQIAQETRLEVEREKTKMVARHTKTSVFIQNSLVESFKDYSVVEWEKISLERRIILFDQTAKSERVSRGLPSDSIEVKTPEQIRRQQTTEAILYYEEIRHDYPVLSERDCLRVVCEAFEVTPSEIGFDDDDALDDEEPGTE